jgi:hypothetical protein
MIKPKMPWFQHSIYLLLMPIPAPMKNAKLQRAATHLSLPDKICNMQTLTLMGSLVCWATLHQINGRKDIPCISAP